MKSISRQQPTGDPEVSAARPRPDVYTCTFSDALAEHNYWLSAFHLLYFHDFFLLRFLYNIHLIRSAKRLAQAAQGRGRLQYHGTR